MKKWLFIFHILLSCHLCHASEVILVHFDNKFDGSKIAAKEVSGIINSTDIVINLTSTNTDGWRRYSALPNTINPKFVYFSGNGDHDIAVKGSEIVVAGGFFRACYSNAIMFLFYNNDQKLKITMPMKAIYFNNDSSLFEQFKRNFKSKEDFIEYIKEIATSQWKLRDGTYIIEVVGSNLIISEI